MQKTSYLLLLAAVLIGCYAKIDETKCYDTPDGSLYSLYKNCRKSTDSRETKCMNSVNRYCTDVEYAFIGKLKTTTGVMRAWRPNSNEIFLSCFKTTFKGAVDLSSLSSQVRACNSLAGLQSESCLLAVHKYCQFMHGSHSSGFAYSSDSGNNKALTACFSHVEKEEVSVDSLSSLNSDCNSVSNSASPSCFNAACMWCENKGHSGGITQGSNDNTKIIVSCYKDHFNKWVKVKDVVSEAEYYRERYLAAKRRYEQAMREEEFYDGYRFKSDIREE